MTTSCVRRAINMAVDPQVCLDLGYQRPGHHGGKPPRLRRSTRIRRIAADHGRQGRGLCDAGRIGRTDHVFEIVSIDDDYRRPTTDAVAAQLRDAGFTWSGW
jgi:peptide/nickel transport system substrate-binding protein